MGVVYAWVQSSPGAGVVADAPGIRSPMPALITYDGACIPQRVRGLKNEHGDDRFRQRLSKQGKRVEEAAMIS